MSIDDVTEGPVCWKLLGEPDFLVGRRILRL